MVFVLNPTPVWRPKPAPVETESKFHHHSMFPPPFAPYPAIYRLPKKILQMLLDAKLLIPGTNYALWSELDIANLLSQLPPPVIQEIEATKQGITQEMWYMVREIGELEQRKQNFSVIFRPDQIQQLIHGPDFFLPEFDKPDEPRDITKRCLICYGGSHLQLGAWSYCRPCLRRSILLSLNSEGDWPPNSDSTNLIPDKVIREETYRPYIWHLHLQRKLEWNRKSPLDRVYCSDARCGAFLCDKSFADQTGERDVNLVCALCRGETCGKCTGVGHQGTPCEYEDDPQDQWQLMESEGHVFCPRCSVAVSLVDGCKHIQCPCGGYFCYICGREYPIDEDCDCPQYNNHGLRLPIALRPGNKPPQFLRFPKKGTPRPVSEQGWFWIPRVPDYTWGEIYFVPYHLEVALTILCDPRVQSNPDMIPLDITDRADSAAAWFQQQSPVIQEAHVLLGRLSSSTVIKNVDLSMALIWGSMELRLGRKGAFGERRVHDLENGKKQAAHAMQVVDSSRLRRHDYWRNEAFQRGGWNQVIKMHEAIGKGYSLQYVSEPLIPQGLPDPYASPVSLKQVVSTLPREYRIVCDWFRNKISELRYHKVTGIPLPNEGTPMIPAFRNRKLATEAKTLEAAFDSIRRYLDIPYTTPPKLNKALARSKGRREIYRPGSNAFGRRSVEKNDIQDYALDDLPDDLLDDMQDNMDVDEPDEVQNVNQGDEEPEVPWYDVRPKKKKGERDDEKMKVPKCRDDEKKEVTRCRDSIRVCVKSRRTAKLRIRNHMLRDGLGE